MKISNSNLPLRSVAGALVLGVALDAHASFLELGYGGLKFDYSETSRQNQWLDSETSDLSQITGGYIKYGQTLEAVLSYEQSVEFYYAFMSGKGAYDGHLQSLTSGALTPYKGTTQHEISQFHARYKIENVGKANKVGWFLGLGQRAWDRNIQGPFGLLEEYRWNYGEIGLSGLWHDAGFFTGFEVSYQHAFDPTMKAHTKGGLDFDLGKTSGYKVAVPLGYELNQQWSVSVNYVIDQWESKASEPVGGFYEPQSSAKNEYAFVALRYNF